MAQEPSSKDLLEAVKQQESGGRRYKADGKTLLEGPQTKYGTAKGEMQVLDMTNRDPGFGVRPAKDDSPDERARVGEDYLAAMVKRYGNRETALVAYNWGPGNTDNWLKSGADPAKLPKETQNYVAKITGSLGSTKVAQAPAKAAPVKAGIRKTAFNPTQNPMFAQLGPSYQAAFAVSMLADEGEKEGKSEDEPSESEKMLMEATARPVALASADLSYQSPFPQQPPAQQPIKMAAGGLPFAPSAKVRPSARAELDAIKAEYDAYAPKAAEYNTALEKYKTDVYNPYQTQVDAYNAALEKYKAEQFNPYQAQVDAYNAALNKYKIETYDPYQAQIDEYNKGRAEWAASQGSLRRPYPKKAPVAPKDFDMAVPTAPGQFSMAAPTKPAEFAQTAPTAPAVSQAEYDAKVAAAKADAGRRQLALNVAMNPEAYGLSMPKLFADGGQVSDPYGEQVSEGMMANRTAQPDGTDTLWGPDIPVSRSAKELKAYTEAMNPAVKTFTGGLGMGTRGYIYADEPDIINLNTALTPGEREVTMLHELEHSMDARGGDMYGRPKFAKMGGMDNNYRAYHLMGDNWDSIKDTVKNMVENREKLEKFFGRPLDNSYFRQDSYDNLKKIGKERAMFSEQLASLSALEQTTGKSLTQDPEMRELFPNTKMMAVYDALTGPRQTRMDARDLPPHTPVPSYTYQQNPALRFIQKNLTGENEYGTSYRPFPIKRAKGSPETGEVGYFQDPFGVPDSGPVTADTLSKGKEFKAADALKAVKEVGTGVARNVKAVAQGVSETPYNLVGGVADIGNLALTPFGLGSKEPALGSEHLKRLALEAGIRQAPPTNPQERGMYMMGELGASIVNPGPIAAKGGKAAEMLAKDFQKYNQALGPAGVAYAVKPTKGGRFVGYETPSGQFVDSVDELIQSGGLLPDPRPDLQIPTQSKQALNEWMQTKLARYIRSDMATENDQFVKATDQGKKLHLHEGIDEALAPMDVEHVRLMEGLPRKGFAKTELGKKVEAQVDSSIFPQTVGDMESYELHPTARYLQDEAPFTRVYQPGYNLADRMQFPKMMEGMEDMLSSQKDFKAYGEFSSPIPEEYHLTPEKLQGLSPVQASEKVALFNQWKEAERQKQAAQYLDKYGNTYKKYDNGRKWIAMDDLAEEPKQAELVQQAGCLGGWCTKDESFAMENGSGDKRLHLLFDEKAVPRVQLTVTKTTPQVEDFVNNMEYYQLNNFRNKYGDIAYMHDYQFYDTPEYQAWARTQDNSERITELKGQFNTLNLAKDPNSRKYLKEVQDFVKSKDWGAVANLDNINMIDLDDYLPPIARGLNPEQTNQLSDFMKSLNGGSRYADKYEGENIVREASLRVLRPLSPPGRATGGMVERQPSTAQYI